MKLFYVIGGIRRGRYKYGFTPFTLNTMYRTRRSMRGGWWGLCRTQDTGPGPLHPWFYFLIYEHHINKSITIITTNYQI